MAPAGPESSLVEPFCEPEHSDGHRDHKKAQ